MLSPSNTKAYRACRILQVWFLSMLLACCVPSLPANRPVAFTLEDTSISIVVNACPGWLPFRAQITEATPKGDFIEPSWTARNYLGSSRADVPLRPSSWSEVSGHYDLRKDLMIEVFDERGQYEIGFWYGRSAQADNIPSDRLAMFSRDGQVSLVTKDEFAQTGRCSVQSSS